MASDWQQSPTGSTVAGKKNLADLGNHLLDKIGGYRDDCRGVTIRYLLYASNISLPKMNPIKRIDAISAIKPGHNKAVCLPDTAHPMSM